MWKFSSAFLVVFIGSSISHGLFTINDLKKWTRNDNGQDGDYTQLVSQDTIGTVERGTAVLAIVEFIGHRGLNKCCAALIVQPKEKAAKDIGGFAYDVKVMDLDHDGVSEIQRETSETGQGYTVSELQIFWVSGLNTIILYRSKMESNDGVYEKPDPRYRVESVEFEYKDLDGDGVLDLIEHRTVETANAVEKSEKRLVFKNGKFIPFH